MQSVAQFDFGSKKDHSQRLPSFLFAASHGEEHSAHALALVPGPDWGSAGWNVRLVPCGILCVGQAPRLALGGAGLAAPLDGCGFGSFAGQGQAGAGRVWCGGGAPWLRGEDEAAGGQCGRGALAPLQHRAAGRGNRVELPAGCLARTAVFPLRPAS